MHKPSTIITKMGWEFALDFYHLSVKKSSYLTGVKETWPSKVISII